MTPDSQISQPRWYRLAINGSYRYAFLRPEELGRFPARAFEPTDLPAAISAGLNQRLGGLLAGIQGSPVGAAERMHTHRDLGMAAPSAAPAGAPTQAPTHFSSLTPGREIVPSPAPGEAPTPEVIT